MRLVHAYMYTLDYIPQIYTKHKFTSYSLVLTHSSLAIWVGVHLAIVLDDGQTGRNGGHHLILAVL